MKKLYHFLIQASLIVNSLLFANHLHAETRDILAALKNKASESESLQWVPNRIGDREAALQLQGEQTVEFPLERMENALLEFWIRVDGWKPEGGVLVKVANDTQSITVEKDPQKEILNFKAAGATVGVFPADQWKQKTTDTKNNARDWHHIALAFGEKETVFLVDGFVAGRAPIAMLDTRELALTLGSPGEVRFDELSWSNYKYKNPDEFRARYLQLYRNTPLIDQPTVTAPDLQKEPDIQKFLEEGEFPGAAVIPGLVAIRSPQERAIRLPVLLKEPITVFLGRFEDRLYLAFRTPYEGDLPGRFTEEHDFMRDYSHQEMMEIFLEPPWTGVTEYVQLMATAHGSKSDLQLMNLSWDGQWTWQTKILKNEWRGMLVLDLKESGLPVPENGDLWRFNVFNQNANAAWGWSQAFHNTSAFGRLLFRSDAPAIVPGHPVVRDGMLKISLQAEGAERTPLTATLERFNPDNVLPSAESKQHIDNTKSITLELPYEEGQEALFALRVQDTDANTLYYQSFALPTQSSLTRPAVKPASAPEEKQTKEEQQEWSAEEIGRAIQETREWYGNSLGKRDDVPVILQPLKAENGRAVLWNRQYDFGNALFLNQIQSNGCDLLSAPIALKVVTPDKSFAVTEAKTKLLETTPRLARVQASAAENNIRITSKSNISFDGLIWYEVEISPEDMPQKITELSLNIPIKKDQARLFHFSSSASGHPPGSDSGGIAETPLNLDFLREILWVGTQREGVTWLVENIYGWPLSSEQSIQSIIPDGKEVLVRIKLGENFVLKENLTFRFALQATPLRPRSPDFRRVADTSRVKWSWFWGDGSYYPFHDHPETARSIIAEERKNGREVMTASSVQYYGIYRFFIPPKPFPQQEKGGFIHLENLLFAPLWLVNGSEERYPGILPETQVAAGDDWKKSLNRPNGQSLYDPASSFQDFYIWKLNRAVDETGLGAIYLDQALKRSRNRWADSEVSRGAPYTVPILGMRSMVERMYNLFEKAHGKSLIRWHSSNQLIIPVFPYVDIYWEGENYGHSISKVYEFYSKLLSPEKMQVQHTGLPFGFAPSLLPMFEQRYAPTPASIRDMMGLMMVHDSQVWPAHSAHMDLIRKIGSLWLDFPYEKAKTFYYWDDEKPFTVSPKEIYPILHLTEERGRMILFNWSDEPKWAEVAFSESLGVKAPMDAETKSPVEQQSDVITILVPPRDFRMLDFDLQK